MTLLHARVILEIVGKPQEHVEKTMNDYIDQITKDTKYNITKQDIAKPEEQEGLFSSFAELEIKIKDPVALLDFCFDYMPSSVEIMEPENLQVKSNDFAQFINDMQGRLHAVNTSMIQLQDNNKFFLKNTAVLLRNFLVVLLSNKPRTLEELQKYMGVKQGDIQKVLNVMIKEGKFIKEGDTYKVK